MEFKGKPKDIYNFFTEYLDELDQEKEVIVVISDRQTKEIRTLSQNRTWYELFWWIAKYLWNDIQEVKIYFMIWCFGSKKLKLSKNEMEIPIISETHKLTKEQWIFLIDTLLTFVKIKDIPIKITPREIQNLYESYN